MVSRCLEFVTSATKPSAQDEVPNPQPRKRKREGQADSAHSSCRSTPLPAGYAGFLDVFIRLRNSAAAGTFWEYLPEESRRIVHDEVFFP